MEHAEHSSMPDFITPSFVEFNGVVQWQMQQLK